MLDYTAIEVLVKERVAERDRTERRARGDEPGREQPAPSFDGQPPEAPLIWAGSPGGDGEPLGERVSDAAAAASDGAGAVAEGAGEAASGFLEAAGHIAEAVLHVLGAILSALGDADWD